MKDLKRITFDPNVMGGKPCIRGMRVTVGTIVGLVASGYSARRFFEHIPIWKLKIFARRWPMLPGGSKRLNFRWESFRHEAAD